MGNSPGPCEPDRSSELDRSESPMLNRSRFSRSPVRVIASTLISSQYRYHRQKRDFWDRLYFFSRSPPLAAVSPARSALHLAARYAFRVPRKYVPLRERPPYFLTFGSLHQLPFFMLTLAAWQFPQPIIRIFIFIFIVMLIHISPSTY